MLELQACHHVACHQLKGFGAANTASLAELLSSFFVTYWTACQQWLLTSKAGFRYAKLRPNDGKHMVAWSDFKHWHTSYASLL